MCLSRRTADALTEADQGCVSVVTNRVQQDVPPQLANDAFGKRTPDQNCTSQAAPNTHQTDSDRPSETETSSKPQLHVYTRNTSSETKLSTLITETLISRYSMTDNSQRSGEACTSCFDGFKQTLLITCDHLLDTRAVHEL